MLRATSAISMSEKRKAGIEVAKKWLDGAAMLGAKSMRVNSGGPRIAPSPVADPSSYPKNNELAQYLTNCIESFKEMADYGGKVGVKVTLENHWGLTANPINIRIIIEEVNNPSAKLRRTSATGSTSTFCSTLFRTWRPMPTPTSTPNTGIAGRIPTSSAMSGSC